MALFRGKNTKKKNRPGHHTFRTELLFVVESDLELLSSHDKNVIQTLRTIHDHGNKEYSDFVICASCIFWHNFVSGMHGAYFNESQDAIVLQTCH